MSPYLQDVDFTLYVGDVTEVLGGLPDESVHCVVTSPPYWGLRDYGTGVWAGGDPDCDHETVAARNGRGGSGAPGKQTAGAFPSEFAAPECGKCGATRTDQQLGLEPTPEQYVENMVVVFREVRRVLRRDGTCWLNIGDSYAHGTPGGGSVFDNGRTDGRTSYEGDKVRGREKVATLAPGLKPKDLVGIPWRLAFALQQDGWYLRSEIIWAKPNPMPESVTDRPTKAHEQVFLLTRSPRYFFDADAVREPYIDARSSDPARMEAWRTGEAYDDHSDKWAGPAHGPDGRRKTTVQAGGGSAQHRDGERWPNPSGRNLRSVWEIATQPYPEAHFATFPEALVERCVKAGTSERGCCPVCGAPWGRVTETSYVPSNGGGKRGRVSDGHDRRGHHKEGVGERATRIDTTLGWKPTCGHERPGGIGGPLVNLPVPCVVLDPFMGSGTTALVARNLGRHSIGIELNEQYAQLAAHGRMAQQSLLTEAG